MNKFVREFVRDVATVVVGNLITENRDEIKKIQKEANNRIRKINSELTKLLDGDKND